MQLLEKERRRGGRRSHWNVVSVHDKRRKARHLHYLSQLDRLAVKLASRLEVVPSMFDECLFVERVCVLKQAIPFSVGR